MYVCMSQRITLICSPPLITVNIHLPYPVQNRGCRSGYPEGFMPEISLGDAMLLGVVGPLVALELDGRCVRANSIYTYTYACIHIYKYMYVYMYI